MKRFLITFVIMLAFWFALSWRFDLLNITAGLVGSFLVAYASRDLLIRKGPRLSIKKLLLLTSYLVSLAYKIVAANVDVAARVLHPKMPIQPQLVRFRTKLRSDVAKAALANSITLTPGTITVDVRGDVFYVHALSKKSMEDLLRREMEQRLLEIFE